MSYNTKNLYNEFREIVEISEIKKNKRKFTGTSYFSFDFSLREAAINTIEECFLLRILLVLIVLDEYEEPQLHMRECRITLKNCDDMSPKFKTSSPFKSNHLRNVKAVPTQKNSSTNGMLHVA